MSALRHFFQNRLVRTSERVKIKAYVVLQKRPERIGRRDSQIASCNKQIAKRLFRRCNEEAPFSSIQSSNPYRKPVPGYRTIRESPERRCIPLRTLCTSRHRLVHAFGDESIHRKCRLKRHVRRTVQCIRDNTQIKITTADSWRKAIKATLYADKAAFIHQSGDFGKYSRIVTQFTRDNIGGERYSAKLQQPFSLQNIHR